MLDISTLSHYVVPWESSVIVIGLMLLKNKFWRVLNLFCKIQRITVSLI